MSGCPSCGAQWSGDTLCHSTDCDRWPMVKGHEKRTEGSGQSAPPPPLPGAPEDRKALADLIHDDQREQCDLDPEGFYDCEQLADRIIAAGWSPTAQAVKVDQPRGLRPLAPEGLDTTCVICCGDASSLGSWVDVRMGYQHTGSETRYGNRLVCRDCRERIVESMRARWPTPTGGAAAAKIDGANAPSPPEGINPVADKVAEIALATVIDLQATIAHERQQHAEAAEKHAAEYHRIATALGCHVHDDLAAKAAQSRAAAPPIPEGLDCTGCGSPATKLVKMHTHAHEPQPICEACAAQHEASAAEVNEHEMRNFGGAYGLVSWTYLPLPPQAGTAAPPSAANAPSLPEGLIASCAGMSVAEIIAERDAARALLDEAGRSLACIAMMGWLSPQGEAGVKELATRCLAASKACR